MKSLQQAAQEFFDECVKNGIAPQSVQFKSIHICVASLYEESYIFQSADIEGKIVSVKSERS